MGKTTKKTGNARDGGNNKNTKVTGTRDNDFSSKNLILRHTFPINIYELQEMTMEINFTPFFNDNFAKRKLTALGFVCTCTIW